MSLFTSSREKRLWLYAFIVLIPIILTLIFSGTLVGILGNQDVQVGIFWLSLILIGTTIIIHGFNTQPSKTEIAIWVGLIAVYLLFFLRLGRPEHRSHLMEYSVLAICIHRAIIERFKQENQILKPAILAFVLTLTIGMLDECIQIFLPSRVFDPIDMLFNGLAAFMTIGTSISLQWVRKKIS